MLSKYNKSKELAHTDPSIFYIVVHRCNGIESLDGVRFSPYFFIFYSSVTLNVGNQFAGGRWES